MAIFNLLFTVNLYHNFILRAEIIKCADWSTAATFNGNIKDMFFSPLDNYFTVWEMFMMTKENPQVS